MYAIFHRYGNYVYLNDINEIPNNYHKTFIHKEYPGMTINPPKTLLKEKFKTFTKIFVGIMLVPWIK